MKITILKENLNDGLNIVGRVAGKNLTLPILNNILVSAEGNFLSLTSTDLELGIKYWTLCKIEKEGSLTVPAKILSSFVGLLPEKKIDLEVKNQTLHIDCENNKTQIKGLDPQDYPIIPKIEDDNFIELNVAPLCQGLSQVVDFAAPSQARPELSGVYLNLQKDRLQITSTDSFRLAEKTLYLSEKTGREISFILPQKTARELVNIFSERKGKLKLYFSPNQVLFEYLMAETPHPQIQLVSRLVEGDYPDYQGIIPKKYQIQISLPQGEFLNQIRTASIFSGKNNEVKLKIIPKKEEIEILSQNPELGENKSSLNGKVSEQSDKTKEIETVFNHRFLADGLEQMKGSKVLFEINGEEGPAVLRPEDDTNYLYVVMPIRAV